MTVLGLDTATAATAVALLTGDEVLEARHDPAPGERPGHGGQVLALAGGLLSSTGTGWDELELVAVGVGPGSFTGLRIGVSTARALAQATGAALVGVSTLRALAAGAGADSPSAPVLAVLDARRGEAFVAGYAAGREVLAPAAVRPERLAELARAPAEPWLAVGDGAVRFRDALERAGARVPPDDAPAHRVGAAAICRLGLSEPQSAGRDEVVPQYLRLPDAEIARRATTP